MVFWRTFFCTICLLLMFGQADALAAKPNTKPVRHVIKTDSLPVQQRVFNEHKLNEYAKLKDFQYNDTAPTELSWWSRFWRWVGRLIGKLLDSVAGNKSSWFLFRLFLFTLAAAALVFIIFKILGIDIIRIFRGQSKSIDIPYGEALENIHDINFDAELDSAIANHNYKLAVRLLYLRSLKQLSDLELIHWQIEKTNSAYLNELTNDEYRQLFSLLTSRFEYIWYGDFPIDGESFQNLNTLFHDFKKKLS